MSSSIIEIREPRAEQVRVEADALVVELIDGRTLAVPLSWYPRLLHGSSSEQGNWRLIGGGTGIHWPELEEDISVRGLLEGKPSSEQPVSLKRWLQSRTS
jgi:hypothetical protein